VAPHITLVGIGSQVTGALAINLDTWNRLPDDVRAVLEELGPEYSRGVADDLAKRYDASIARMRNEGATIAEFPLAEKEKWLRAMPDIASRWIEATERRGAPAGEVLRTYMSALRARGAQPMRDWGRAP
jgi:TRAP-type C4-dicarboxylate transport system substrate-binding protein